MAPPRQPGRIAGFSIFGDGASRSGGASPTLDARRAAAAIPVAWKSKLAFEVREVGHDDPITAVVPKEWTLGELDGELVPPSDRGMGGSSMFVARKCAGDCATTSARELADNATKTYFAPLLADRSHGHSEKILKDETVAGRRTLIIHRQYQHSDDVHISIALWKDHSARVDFCDVTLDEPAKDLAPAFEAACLALTP